MTDSNYTHLAFLLDRSGSMQSIKTATELGFAAFIEQQAAAPGRCTVTLAQFDSEYEEVYAARDIHDLPTFSLQPRGSTALLDSMARLILDTGRELAALPEDRRPGTVIVGVMTDGHENASKEWTREAVKALVEQQENEFSWTVSYMGANQDAIEVGASLGVRRESSLTYSTENVAEAMAVYGESASAMRYSVAAGAPMSVARDSAAFSDEQRSRAGAAGDADPSKRVRGSRKI